MISKTLSTSVCYARLFDLCPDLAEFAQSLYPLLVAHADDFGREQGDTVTVKYRIHPRSPRSEHEFGVAMQALHDVNLIIWYESRGRQCYQILRFDEHQTGLHKRTRSQFPPVPGSSGKTSEVPGQLKGTEEKGTEENLTEGKRTERNGTEGHTHPAPARSAAPDHDDTRLAPIIDGRAMRRHGQHARCYVARGLCVTPWVWEELLGKLGGDPASRESRLKAWADRAITDLGEAPVGDAPDAFWRKRFAAWIGIEPAPTAGKGQRTTAAVQRGLARYVAQKAGRP